ncbi:MAG: hypothetical protein K8R23_07790 [Chthoniobacter sp.]|nr:hypothetical protein [Chthoniobacter sp.]
MVQDNFATLYGNWLTRPHLLIEEEALEDGLELLAEPEESLDETFTEPAETADASEDLGMCCTVPTFFSFVALGFCLGFLFGLVLLLIACIETISGGWLGGRGLDIAFVTFPVAFVIFTLSYGLYGGLICIPIWPFILLGRSCRRHEKGQLPSLARAVLLVLAIAVILFWHS